MARDGKYPAQGGGAQISSSRRELPMASSTSREALSPRIVMDGLRKRVMHIGGVDWKSEKEIEKEKEEKLEKARAAAWAWYQHGKGGKESVSYVGGLAGSVSTLSIKAGGSAGESPHKSSRFKSEALKSSGEASSSHSSIVEELSDPSWEIVNPPSPPQPQHQFQPPGSSRRVSSLFDSYELDSVSKRIDFAFQSEVLPVSEALRLRAQLQKIQRGLPVPVPPAGASTSSTSKKGLIVGSKRDPSTPSVNKSRSFRLQLPSFFCKSISDVISRDELALGIDIGKCACHTARANSRMAGSGGLNMRKVSKALQAFMHLPECKYHPQQEHHERRLTRLQHGEDHGDDEDYHDHLHYQIKLRDGVHHGKSSTTHPAKSDWGPGLTIGKDDVSFRRLNPQRSPKLCPESCWLEIGISMKNCRQLNRRFKEGFDLSGE